MPLTGRKLIENLQKIADDNGDSVLDLPLTTLQGASIVEVDYQARVEADHQYEEEPELLYLTTSWD